MLETAVNGTHNGKVDHPFRVCCVWLLMRAASEKQMLQPEPCSHTVVHSSCILPSRTCCLQHALQHMQLMILSTCHRFVPVGCNPACFGMERDFSLAVTAAYIILI